MWICQYQATETKAWGFRRKTIGSISGTEDTCQGRCRGNQIFQDETW